MDNNIEPIVFDNLGNMTEYGLKKFKAFIEYIKLNYSQYAKHITDELYSDMFIDMEEQGQINPFDMIQNYVTSQSFIEPF